MALETIKKIANNRALVELPRRGRALVDRIPKPIQLHMRRYSRRSAVILFEVILGFAFVGLVAVALLHMQLKNGPLELGFLVKPVEESINRELAGLHVDVEKIVLKRREKGVGVAVRLINVKLFDEQEGVVAQAPEAAIGLSGRALIWGQLAAGSIDLIGPKLVLFYQPEAGLALTFSKPDKRVDLAGEPSSSWGNVKIIQSTGRAETIVERQQPSRHVVREQRQIDLAPTVYKALEGVRLKKNASSYLSRVGFRQAVVEFDHKGHLSQWSVPDFSIELEHKKKRSIILGGGDVSAGDDDWTIGFKTEQSDKKQSLSLALEIDNLVPKNIAKNFPGLATLASLNMPLKGVSNIDLSRSGDVLGARAFLELASGQIIVPWEKTRPLQLDQGVLRLAYQSADRTVSIEPSYFRWGKSEATLSGRLQEEATDSGEKFWRFALTFSDAKLAVEQFGVSAKDVGEWVLNGRVSGDGKTVWIDRFRLGVDDGAMEFSGQIISAPEAKSPAVKLNGQLAARSAETFKRLWPKFLAPLARKWVGEHLIQAGNVVGQFKVDLPAGMLAKARHGGEVPDQAVSLRMIAEDLGLLYKMSMPPLWSKTGTLTINGRQLVFDVPQGQVKLASGRSVDFEYGRFEIADLRPRYPTGVVHFKTSSALDASLELLDHEPFRVRQKSKIRPGQFSGDSKSDIKMFIPMRDKVTLADMDIKGLAKINRLGGESLLGGIKIKGGSIDFDITEKALGAKGNILLNGVPAKISWQRIFGGKSARQPAVRISGVFDDSARKQLGLPIDYMLKGDVPAVLSMSRNENQKLVTHLEADLSNALVRLPNMGFEKKPGRAAQMEFDIVKNDKNQAELQNFKVVGDDIAIDGWVRLDEKGGLEAYYFPDFSFNIISQMEVSGRKGEDQIWQVRAKGSTYDGRQFFRSLFSGGGLSRNEPRAGVSRGVDLVAEIDHMVGHFDAYIKDLKLNMKKRNGRITDFSAKGHLNGATPVIVDMPKKKKSRVREIVAQTKDAGTAFRLVGFYPRIYKGTGQLSINLDGKGDASATGRLTVRNFDIIGQPVVDEAALASARRAKRRKTQQQTVAYEKIDFNVMSVPFSVGHGQFVLKDAQLNGPLLGATARGWVDFEKEKILVGGTYSPAYGLNTLPGEFPIFGPLLRGREGEGLFGLTYVVQGPISSPEVVVNPVSMVLPGFLRQMMEMSPQAPRVKPRRR